MDKDEVLKIVDRLFHIYASNYRNEAREEAEEMIEELENSVKKLTVHDVSKFVCPDCKGNNMVESNKREVWCYGCKKNYRENVC